MVVIVLYLYIFKQYRTAHFISLDGSTLLKLEYDKTVISATCYSPAIVTTRFIANPIHAHVHTAEALRGFVRRQLKYKIHPTSGIRNDNIHHPIGEGLSSVLVCVVAI